MNLSQKQKGAINGLTPEQMQDIGNFLDIEQKVTDQLSYKSMVKNTKAIIDNILSKEVVNNEDITPLEDDIPGMTARFAKSMGYSDPAEFTLKLEEGVKLKPELLGVLKDMRQHLSLLA